MYLAVPTEDNKTPSSITTSSLPRFTIVQTSRIRSYSRGESCESKVYWRVRTSNMAKLSKLALALLTADMETGRMLVVAEILRMHGRLRSVCRTLRWGGSCRVE